MAKEVICSNCGSNLHYVTFCLWKKRKPISQRGKHAKMWVTFRDTIAKPYLDKKYGHVCAVKGCHKTEGLEVDHKKTRGAASHLRYDVKNIQYLCWEHHRQKHDGKLNREVDNGTE